jgi:hypothetical protein
MNIKNAVGSTNLSSYLPVGAYYFLRNFTRTSNELPLFELASLVNLYSQPSFFSPSTVDSISGIKYCQALALALSRFVSVSRSYS